MIRSDLVSDILFLAGVRAVFRWMAPGSRRYDQMKEEIGQQIDREHLIFR